MPSSTGYMMVLYVEGTFVFIRNDYKFEINGKTYSFGLKSSEKIVYAAGGYGGIVVTTNENTYFYPDVMADVEPTQEPLNLPDVGIYNENISRIEVATVPIVYLTNLSVYVYKKAVNEPSDDSDDESEPAPALYPGCTEEIDGVDTLLKLKKSDDANVTRYLPFAAVESEGSTVKSTAYYLTNESEFYKCTNTLQGEEKQIGTAEIVSSYPNLRDIYILGDNTMYVNMDDDGNMIKFQIDKQLISAERTLSYRVYVGAKDPQAWFAADPTINGVGQADQTKLEGNSIYLMSSTKIFAQGLTSGVEISDFALSGS